MSDSRSLRSRPPRIVSDDTDAMDAFIGGAGVQTTLDPVAPPKPAPLESVPYPWDAPGVRADIAKVFNLRLPEPYLFKLKHIAEHTPASMQQFCLNVLLPAIDAKIEELTGT